MEEGRRIKAHIEERNFSSLKLRVLYCFKIAVYAEFRRDWPEAQEFYEEGVCILREVCSTVPCHNCSTYEDKHHVCQCHDVVDDGVLEGVEGSEAVAGYDG